MSTGIIARRYSKALGSLASDDKELQVFRQELKTVTEAFIAEHSLFSFFANPKILKSDKVGITETILKKIDCHRYVSNLIRLLVKCGRIIILPELNLHFERLTLNRLNQTKVTILSAVAINEVMQGELLRTIEQSIRKKIIPTFEIDESLIGGVVLKIGNTEVDGSVKNYFYQLQKTIL